MLLRTMGNSLSPKCKIKPRRVISECKVKDIIKFIEAKLKKKFQPYNACKKYKYET